MSSKSAQIQHFVRTRSGLSIVFGTAFVALAATLPGAIESLVAAVVGGLLFLTGLTLRLEHLEARSAEGYELEGNLGVLQESLEATEQNLFERAAVVQAGLDAIEQRLDSDRDRHREEAELTAEREELLAAQEIMIRESGERIASQEIMIRESAERIQHLQPLPDVVAALKRTTEKLDGTKTSSDAFEVLSSKFSLQVDALGDATAAIGELQDRVDDIGERLSAIDEARAGSCDRLVALERVANPHLAAAADRLDALTERLEQQPVPSSEEPLAVDLTKLVTEHLPSVTVVVTCFNHQDFVGDCLKSVANQTFTDFECFVVDDASTDESVARMREQVSQDDRFVVLEHDDNKGPSAARNTGIRHARAPFICFLDSDDLLLANSLQERFFALLQVTDRNVAGVFSGIASRPQDASLDELPPAMEWSGGRPADFITSRGECPFNLHAPMLRTDIIRRATGFVESMRVGAEDWELWLRIMRNGFRFVPTKSTLGIYRQKQDSLVRAFPADHLAASTKLLESVQNNADPSGRMASAPFFYELPLPHYDAEIVRSKRAFQYIGLAALAPEAQELSRALESVPKNLAQVLRWHASPVAQLDSGLARGLGLSSDDRIALETKLSRVSKVLVDLALAADEAPPSKDVPLPVVPLTRVQHTRRSPSPIKLFWWQAAEGVRGKANFGDELSPMLVSLVSGREVVWADKDACELVALGSVLDLVVGAQHRGPATWGTGFITAGTTTGAGLHISSTRGFVTSQRCGSIGGVGDPALLTRYLDVQANGSYRVGLIPHYVDWDQPFTARFDEEVPGSIVINPLSPPMDVVNAIAGCDFVFSSSLHGLIVADSLGVPNAWIELSEKVVGNGYKFGDYYSCFPIDRPDAIRPSEPSELDALISELGEHYQRPGLEALIAGVADSFPTHI